MTLQGGHITKDGWILILMAVSAIFMAATVWLGMWTFYAPISKETFTEYKEGAKAATASIDMRLASIEQKIDDMNNYMRGIPVPAHGR